MKQIFLLIVTLLLLVGSNRSILGQTVTVAGAGSSAVDGSYTLSSPYTFNGKNFYAGGSYILYWEPGYTLAAWKIADGGGHGCYLNTANTTLPPATGWQVDNTYGPGGSLPVPTLSGDVDLPVELTSFSASINHALVNLQWTTATEINNFGFDIERNANNSWAKIGFVQGNGTSNTPHSYSYTEQKLPAGTYSYRLKQIDHNGAFTYSQEVNVQVGTAPKVFGLGQNYPNPFNPTTAMQFTVPSDGRTTLDVYNTLGQKVATLFDAVASAGEYHQATFDGSRFASGIYFARLEFGGRTLVKKLLMVK
jgi:Secretion system C-terminal sorting domain